MVTRRIRLILALTVVVAVFLVFRVIIHRDYGVSVPVPEGGGSMKLTSVAFPDGGNIPAMYTCDGVNVSPPLTFGDIPSGSVSLALVADDPDAPVGTWTHWAVWNIDSRIGGVAEGQTPKGGVSGKTSFGTTGYGGPCPPSGTHRYVFTLYALDRMLPLAAGSDIGELSKAMDSHVLATGTLVGRYSRVAKR